MKSAGTFNGGAVRVLLKRYARFCVVGATGVAVDMGIIYLLADPSMLGWNLTLSNQRLAKIRFASSKVSFDPMSYQTPGTVHV